MVKDLEEFGIEITFQEIKEYKIEDFKTYVTERKNKTLRLFELFKRQPVKSEGYQV